MSTSVVRDFSSPEGSRARAATFHQIPHLAVPPASPEFRRSPPSRDRRASVSSRWSATSSNGQSRQRKVSRANTVKTYREPEHATVQPGAEPGIDTAAHDEHQPAHVINLKAKCDIKIIDFSESDVLESMADNDDIAAFLASPRPEELPCRWISVNGLDWDVIRILGNKFNLHRLAIEDLTMLRSRTKVDWYSDHAFMILTFQKLVKLHHNCNDDNGCDCHDFAEAKMEGDKNAVESHDEASEPHHSWWRRWPRRQKKKQTSDLPFYLDRDRDGKVDEFVRAHSGNSEDSPVKPIRTMHRYESSMVPAYIGYMERHSALAKKDLTVSVEQVGIFLLAENTVISFFEHSAEDVEDPIMRRLRSEQTILRRSVDASLLTQALIDVIVDLAVPVKNAYNESRKELQVDALTNPDVRTSRALHIFGEEVDMLQNLFKPIVHLVNALRDHNPEPINTNIPAISPMDQEAQSPKSKDLRPFMPGKTKRDRDGAPILSRAVSDFRKTPLKRSTTATSVSITPLAHTYFGDVLDHCITMISALEQMDASATNISTLIFNTVGAKTNNFMMILAVVTVFFAPLTFISGYFGMNFADGSGLAHPFAFFWVVAIPSLVGFMLIVFATMLWDNIEDFFEKRGVQAALGKARRRRRY